MSNKSYLKQIVQEEYNKLTKQSIESIIKEEYEKIVQEQQEETIKINKDNWEEWWDSDNNNDSKYEPIVQASADAEDAVDVLTGDLKGYWAGDIAAGGHSAFRKDPAINVDLAMSFTSYLGQTPQISQQGKIFLDPEIIDAPPLNIKKQSLIFNPNGTVSVAYSVNNQLVTRDINWWYGEDDNGVEVINLNLSRNQEERTYVGSLYNKNGSVIIKKQEEITYANYKLDQLQTAFDWAGLAPVIGVPIDVINTVIYLVRGRYVSAIFSAVAIIPFFGDALRGGSKGLGKIISKVGLSRSRYLKMTKSMWGGSLDSIMEFYSLLLKEPDIVKQIAGARGSVDDALDIIRKAIDDVAENQQKFKQWLKSDRMLIPDVLEDALRLEVNKFGNFISNNIVVLQELKGFAQTQRQFKLKPDFEFLSSISPKKLGLIGKAKSNITSALTRMTTKTIINVGGKLAARIGLAKYTFGASEAAIRLTRKAFGPLFDPNIIKPIEQAYSKLVMKKLTRNPDIMASIAQNMSKTDIDQALGGAQQVKELVSRYFKNRGTKFTGQVDEIEKTLQRTDFWTDAEIVDQLSDVITIGTKKATKGESLLSLAANSGNPAFDIFFSNKQWQYQSLFNRNIRFLYEGNIGQKTAAFIKEYFNLKKNLFGRKSLDIWWNEWTELASTLQLTPTEAANPDSVIIPLLFGMLDVSFGSEVGSTRKTLTRSNTRAVAISAALKKYFEAFRDFGNIFPYMDELSNRLYKYIFTDKIQKFLQDPDGKLRIPAFKININTYEWFYQEANKRYGREGLELENMMKIFDEEFWNKLKPEVRENLSDLREQFETALAEQKTFAPRQDEL